MSHAAESEDLMWLKTYHLRQIHFIQHERLIHLKVLSLTTILWFLNVLYLLDHLVFGLILVFILLGVLEVFYLTHYMKLENTVQRWYGIYNDLDKQSSN
jgi:hypothetical protein